MAHATEAPPGSLVGHYQLLSQVGAGGMGVVFKAFDTKLERTVALKFLAPTCGTDDRERLLREARSASALDHKNIASIHAVEENDNGQLFIVMAYYDGESLAERMSRICFLPAEVFPIVRQIAEGLQHAHLHNLIHRDIKPSNVILPIEGEAKIVDFGLARLVSADAATQSRSLAGTLSYMSPEQLEGRAVDARTDIWSLGVVAYQLLTNNLPFRGENPAAVIRAVLRGDPAIESLPDEWQLVLQRALSKNVGSRYQSCTELLRDLDAAQKLAEHDQREQITLAFDHRVQPVGEMRKPRCFRFLHTQRPTILAAVLALMIVASGMVGLQQWSHRGIRRTVSRNSVAYESYLRGLDLLARYDKPENLDAAIQSFEGTTKADPLFSLAFAALGESYWNKYLLDPDRKWIDGATAACKRATEINDQLPAVYVTLGRIHDGTGKHELALQEFQRALDLDHRNADALLGLADSYARVGRSQEAEDTYKRAAAMRPENWSGPYRLGSFYFQQGRFEEAENQFRKVIELTPDNAQAHSGLGTALLQRTRSDEAEAELKKSIELRPTYFAYSNLGLVYFAQKRWADAVTMLNAALKLSRNDFRVWANLAVSYEWLSQHSQAAEAYREELIRLEPIARLRPEDSSLQCELGLLYSKQHLRNKAIPLVQAALAQTPQDADVLTCAGESYYNLGDRLRALRYLAEAIDNGLPIRELEQNPTLRILLSDPALQSVFASRSINAKSR
jgi:tetratricopeptide (TPR) repeat protein